MTAWQKLLAASTLSAGTAWALISSPKTGLGAGLVVNDGVAVELAESDVAVEVLDMQVDVEVDATPVAVEVDSGAVVVEVELAPLEIEVTT